jgi:hypothetical protein
MSAPDDYCELCDLPRSQCIHGRPPTEPKKAAPPAPKPRKRPAARPSTTAPTKVVNRRWNPPETFKPLILTVLERAGGELEAEELFSELEVLAADRLLPEDTATTPEGELRWRYAARRARVALIDEGLMTRARPGLWQLAPGRR